MKVAPLRYDVIFKKAFSDPVLFKALVKDFLHIDNLEIDEVENDKTFYPNFKFALFAQDNKNRIIIEMQHAHYSDTYARFLYYQCCAMVEPVVSAINFPITVNTLVFFTHKHTPSSEGGILELDFQARDISNGKVIGK